MPLFPIPSREKVDFVKNLSVMLKSGMTINESLEILGESARAKRFRAVLGRVRAHIEQGTPLAEAFRREKRVFGDVAVSLIEAGERSGTLDENLAFLSDWMERNEDLRAEIKAATLYPKFVFGATILLGAGLTVYILPKLTPLFTSLDVELPFITKVLLSFSLFISSYWVLAIFLFAAFAAGIFALNKIPPIRYAFHAAYIRAPFVGGLVLDYQLALATELFATLFKSGLLMSETLDIVSKSATNLAYRRSLLRIRDRVDAGETLSEAMKNFPSLYPRNLIGIVATGERSGTLDQSFAYLSEFYTKEVKIRTKKLPTIIEPALLIFIAFFVGLIAIAVIMPIYQLTGGLSK